MLVDTGSSDLVRPLDVSLSQALLINGHSSFSGSRQNRAPAVEMLQLSTTRPRPLRPSRLAKISSTAIYQEQQKDLSSGTISHSVLTQSSARRLPRSPMRQMRPLTLASAAFLDSLSPKSQRFFHLYRLAAAVAIKTVQPSPVISSVSQRIRRHKDPFSPSRSPDLGSSKGARARTLGPHDLALAHM